MPQLNITVSKTDTGRANRFKVTGAGSVASAVNDGSDATYIRRSAAGSPGAYCYLGAASVPAGSDVATVVPAARVKQPTGVSPKILGLNLYCASDRGAHTKTPQPKTYTSGPKIGFPGVYAAATNVVGDASDGAALAPSGDSWNTVVGMGWLRIAADDGHSYTDANRDTIYELSAVAYYAARPTSSVAIDASTPLSATSFPLFNVTVSALIEAWQDDVGLVTGTDCPYQLRIFTAAQVAAQGFDAAVTAPVFAADGTAPLAYVDGVTLSSVTVPEACDTPLINGSYVAYVRAIRPFAGATYADWATLAFTVAVTPPNAPTVSATTDAANQRMAVTVTPVTTSGATNPAVSLQRSSDGGLTWADVRSAVSVPCTFGTPITFYDYTAPRGVALTYRAHVVATISAQQLVSAWATAAATGPAPTGTGWNLKNPDVPSTNIIGALVRRDPEFEKVEEVAEYNPIGRTYPVVVSLSLNGVDGSFDIDARTDAEWADLTALMAVRAPIFLESPFGWGRWIRIMPSGGGRSAARTWTEIGTPAAPVRRVHITYREVAEP